MPYIWYALNIITNKKKGAKLVYSLLLANQKLQKMGPAPKKGPQSSEVCLTCSKINLLVTDRQTNRQTMSFIIYSFNFLKKNNLIAIIFSHVHKALVLF